MGKVPFSAKKLSAIMLAAIFFPLAHSSVPAGITYGQLESIRDDLHALHDIRAPAWVNAPNMRGTSSILYSCILTIFACVYTALHLNIPQKNSSFFRLFLNKLKWVLIALFCPEMALYLAFEQFWEARELSKYLRKKEREQSVSGTALQHKPGWLRRACRTIVFRGSNEHRRYETMNDKETGENENVFDLKYGFYVVMGGFEISDRDGNLCPLSVKGVKWISDNAESIEVLRFPRSRIVDGSKADVLQKCLVLLQVAWMAAQCIARKAYGLPLCLLELHTMVHVVCAVLMYAFWMEKPLDLRSSEKIEISQDLIGRLTVENAEIEAANARAIEADKGFDCKETLFHLVRGNLRGVKLSWMVSDINKMWDYILAQRHLLVLGLTLPIPYGGIHLSAWNFEFPTKAEAVIWKVACMVIALYLPILLGIAFITVLFDRLVGLFLSQDNNWGCMPDLADIWIFFVGGLITTAAAFSRIYVLFEAFFSLRSVPIGIYWSPSWIQMMPHF